MPNDPRSYFQSYGRQQRAIAAQYAAGQTLSTRKNPLPTPDYYGKPRLGVSLKTTFQNGALPDPVNYQPASTFHHLFRPPADVARDVAGHVVLEGPSGQSTKQRMGLPYSTHSIVNPFKSVAFDGGLRDLMKSGLRKEDGFITGSMSLLGHGMLGRESNDIDFVLNSSGRARVREMGMAPTDNKTWQSFNIGKIEAWDEGGHGADSVEEDYQKAEDLRGWKVQRPSRALELKSRLNRPKDRGDLAELGFRPPPDVTSSVYTTNAAGVAVPQHNNLETDSARRFIRPSLWGNDDPYNAHSTVNPFKAAFFTARAEFSKVFGKDIMDRAIKTGADYAAADERGHPYLDIANSFVKGIHEGFSTLLNSSPSAYARAEQFAASSRSFTKEKDFGESYGNLLRAGADLFGVNVNMAEHVRVDPRQLRVSRFVLTNLIGPKLLLGLTFVPLVKEVAAHARHAFHQHVAKNMAEEHHNLETPTGRHLKDTLGLPYQTHSIVDMEKVVAYFGKVADAFRTKIMPEIEVQGTEKSAEFPGMRKFADDLATRYPDLIGRPRTVLRSLYDLQTSAYAYFAQHDNLYLSTFARTMLMAEKVEHVLDYTYKFSPSRFGSKLFRAMVGSTKRDYEHLAMQGIETGIQHANIRRIVRVGGVAIGVIETVFRYEHALHETERLWHKYVRPDQDPEEGRRRQLERERRRGYREAQRRGQQYDPTLPARQSSVTVSAATHLIEEITEQLNPIQAAKRFVTAVRDPRKHIQSLAMYGAFAVYMGTTARKTSAHLAHEAESSATKFAYTYVKEFFHDLAPAMRKVTGLGGLVGFVFGRSASARAGAFANVGATYVADWIGQWAGTKFIRSDAGRVFAAKAYLQVSRIPDYLEINNKFIRNKFEGAAKTSETLFLGREAALGDTVKMAAFEEAERVAGNVGMEVGGIILEGSLLIPFRKALRAFGNSLDKTSAMQHARRIARRLDRRDRDERREKQRDDSDLRRYLSTFSAPAFSQADLLSNPDYGYVQRAALFLTRRTQGGSALLDSVGSVVNRVRRARSGVSALFNTREGGKREREDWRIRLTRAYNAPAYSQVDIATNPQYNVTQRLALAAISHTDRGGELFQAVSPAVTNIRKLTAWMEGLTHPHEVGEHAITHIGHHAHHAVRHALSDAHDRSQQNGASAAVADVLHTFSGVVNDTGNAIKDAKQSHDSRKSKVRVRTKASTRDHALDENMLHNAYSRYINYGHEGSALAYSDQDQN